MKPGCVAGWESEYKRCGTTNVFCGVEPKAGRHDTQSLRTGPRLNLPIYVMEIAEYYPAADTIHLVMDNLRSHTRKAVVARYGEKAGGMDGRNPDRSDGKDESTNDNIVSSAPSLIGERNAI